MTWRVEWDDRAARELRRLDKKAQSEILRYLRERVEGSGDPCQFGKALAGDKRGLWRYRIGDYRLICHMEEDRFIVLVLAVGHRKDVYNKH